jgi:hypothetical protein
VKQFLLLCIFFLFSSCHKYNSTDRGQLLYFEGLKNKEVLLSQMSKSKSGENVIVPLERIFTNTKIYLPAGKYILSNECSSFEFTQKANSPTRIVLSHIQLQLLQNLPNTEEIADENQVIETRCYNVLNQKEETFENKVQFDILPGQNNFFVSGKNLKFNFPQESFQNLTYRMTSLSLTSSQNTPESPHFFVMQNIKNDEKNLVITAPINGKIWLFPGAYSAEVNGTKRNILLNDKTEQSIPLGLLKISSPKNFPYEKRIHNGGQPILAFIDDKVLLRLNTIYPVFPGKYKINLDNSDLEKEITVSEKNITEVKTFGAQINAPTCSEGAGACFTPSEITIHENKMPFILMVVPVDQPFLVFEQNDYQYGIEGVKGIFKSLPTSSDSVKSETLGLVNIKWEIRYTNSNNTTDFVRFESKSPNLFGKSVDLTFSRPSQVFLPQGEYWFTYYVGDAMNPNTPKIKTEINLLNGNSKDITVPLYIHGNREPQTGTIPQATSSESTTLSPIKK